MKTKLISTLAALALTMAFTTGAFAKDAEVTITGEGQCGKCALHETDECQNTITVDKAGKKTTYYLAQNKVSKDFHSKICKAPAKMTATGMVKEVKGKMEMEPTKIELVKDK